MSQVTVITSAFHEEAGKWRHMSERLVPITSAVDNLGLSLSAFFIGDANAAVHSGAYNGFQSYMSTVLAGGVVEFDQLGTALGRIADEYDRADKIADLDLDKIYTA